jgi:hypothetical protein
MNHTHSSSSEVGGGWLRRAVAAGLPCALLVACLAALSACGRDPSAAPLGSAENPAVPRVSSERNATREAGSRSPGYRDLVAAQSSKPRTRVTPCALVTRAQAQSIVGVKLLEPLEAPQGPTCIYRTTSGKNVLTVAVQSADIKHLKRQMRDRHRVSISDKFGYCGTFGRPTLYMKLSRDRVLSVSAPCAMARQFAAKALPQLP